MTNATVSYSWDLGKLRPATVTEEPEMRLFRYERIHLPGTALEGRTVCRAYFRHDADFRRALRLWNLMQPERWQYREVE